MKCVKCGEVHPEEMGHNGLCNDCEIARLYEENRKLKGGANTVVVVVDGGVVVNVLVDTQAKVYILDYANIEEPQFSLPEKHEEQEFSPSIGQDNIDTAFAEWDSATEGVEL